MTSDTDQRAWPAPDAATVVDQRFHPLGWGYGPLMPGGLPQQRVTKLP